MKLLIDDVIILSSLNPVDISEEDLEYQTEICEDLRKLLTRLRVHHSVEDREIGISVYLYQQKIVLSEWEINTLFYALNEIEQFHIEYSPLGGEGCDLTLEVKSKDSKSLP